MVTSILGLPLFPWTPVKGYALGDANYENFRYLNHFLADRPGPDRCASTTGSSARSRASPGSTASPPTARAGPTTRWTARSPTSPTRRPTGCSGALGARGLPAHRDPDPRRLALGLRLGHRPRRGRRRASSARTAIPRLFRRDYVTNGNDSHWLSNPEQPLTATTRIIGDEATERSLRTRLGLVMVQQRLAGTDGLAGKGFTLRKLAEVALGNRQYAGELWRDELVAFCEQNPSLTGAAGPVDVSGACPVLAAWDLRDDLDSHGRDPLPPLRLAAARQLHIAADRGLERLRARARRRSSTSRSTPPTRSTRRAASTPTTRWSARRSPTRSPTCAAPASRSTAPCAEYQYETRGGKRIPIHGGPGHARACSTRSTSTWDPEAGYPTSPTARASSPR